MLTAFSLTIAATLIWIAIEFGAVFFRTVLAETAPSLGKLFRTVRLFPYVVLLRLAERRGWDVDTRPLRTAVENELEALR